MDDFSFILMYVGLATLSLSLIRHSRQVWSGKILSNMQTIWLRIIGWIILIFSAIICMDQQGAGVGLVFWLGLLTVAIFIQVIILTYQSQKFIEIGLAVLLFSFLVLLAMEWLHYLSS